jgi:hypothetical protein
MLIAHTRTHTHTHVSRCYVEQYLQFLRKSLLAWKRDKICFAKNNGTKGQ